jgi:cobalt-zinc-cadmium efflux system membrane fusion protein
MTPSIAVATGVAVLGLAACRPSANRTGTTKPSPQVSAPVRSGNVVRFDPGSPQLERIRVEAVGAAVLPVEEFDAPAKIEAEPTRLARLALPMAGRVRQVAVTLGDLRRQCVSSVSADEAHPGPRQ